MELRERSKGERTKGAKLLAKDHVPSEAADQEKRWSTAEKHRLC